MNMNNPPHPGIILKEDILPEMNLTVTEAAKQLDYDMWQARQLKAA